jgi:ribosomal protein S18 acetylase RimI-like enzyme
MKFGMSNFSNFEISLAGPADVAELMPMVENYHAFEGIESSSETRQTALAQLLGDQWLGRIWLIRHQGQIVGYVAVCFGFSIELGGREAFIDELYIIDRERGRGMGGSAVKEALAWLKAQGFAAVHLEVDTTNGRAQRLYAGLGFAPRGKYQMLSLTLDEIAKSGRS